MATTADHFEAHHEDHAHHDADHKPGFFARWFMSTNHKDIGTLYLIFAIIAGIVGGAISGIMRMERAEPGIQYLQFWAQFMGGSADFDTALRTVNDSVFGLQAGIFTRDLYKAQRAWDVLEVGGVVIGDVPSWRVDHMPYGGVKDSGLGREGILHFYTTSYKKELTRLATE